MQLQEWLCMHSHGACAAGLYRRTALLHAQELSPVLLLLESPLALLSVRRRLPSLPALPQRKRVLHDTQQPQSSMMLAQHLDWLCT
jgi:hypothetical protein